MSGPLCLLQGKREDGRRSRRAWSIRSAGSMVCHRVMPALIHHHCESCQAAAAHPTHPFAANCHVPSLPIPARASLTPTKAALSRHAGHACEQPNLQGWPSSPLPASRHHLSPVSEKWFVLSGNKVGAGLCSLRSTNVRQRAPWRCVVGTIGHSQRSTGSDDGRRCKCQSPAAHIDPGKTRQGAPGLPIVADETPPLPQCNPVGPLKNRRRADLEVSYFSSGLPSVEQHRR